MRGAAGGVHGGTLAFFTLPRADLGDPLVHQGLDRRLPQVFIEVVIADVTLDDATVRANLEAVRQNYLSQRALESRLLAEISNAASVTFHPDLKTSKVKEVFDVLTAIASNLRWSWDPRAVELFRTAAESRTAGRTGGRSAVAGRRKRPSAGGRPGGSRRG